MQLQSKEQFRDDINQLDENTQYNPVNENEKSNLALDFYNPNNEQRQKDMYDYWLQQQTNYQQSYQQLQPAIASTNLALNQIESTRILEFHSVLKMTSILLLCTYLSYVSVSPRSLPLIEYNMAHKDNLLRVFSSLVWPSILLSRVAGNREDVNGVISQFMVSFSVGYFIVGAVEVVGATCMRLAILR